MGRNEALFANEAFYLAFASGDIDAMESLWADRPDVVCVHPGWPALTDRVTVMESWARILGNPDQPQVGFHVVDVVNLGEATLVVCYERMESAVMVASNLFIRLADGPRMVGHHAGVCGDPPALPELTVPSFDA